MRSAKSMKFKAAIKAFAAEEGIPPQVVLQNFMFERFFARLSKSSARNKFILKGGVLVSQYLGLSRRTTMDVDLTLCNAKLDERTIGRLLAEIFAIDLEDGISWHLDRIIPIREDDAYGGLRAKIIARFEMISVAFTVDISTGDVIIPGAIDFFVKSHFAPNEFYRLKSYSVETVLAEKIETILTRGVLSTRPRDFYDAYMIHRTVGVDPLTFRKALVATAEHRGTTSQITKPREIVDAIRTSATMNKLWIKFQREYLFAAGINFDDICDDLLTLADTEVPL